MVVCGTVLNSLASLYKYYGSVLVTCEVCSFLEVR